MTAQGNYNINVGVIDTDAIKKLKDINSQLYKAQAPLKQYQRELKRFNDLSGRTEALRKQARAIENLKNKFVSLKSSVSSIARPMTALFGIGSIAGVVALTRSFANWGNEIRNTSALLNITQQQAIKLSQAGNLAGLGNQAQALKGYQDTQTAVQYGQDASGALADQILGINPNTNFEQAEIQATRRINALMKAGRINATGARNLAKAAGFGEDIVGKDPERLARAFKMAAANAREMAPAAEQAANLRDKFAEAAGRVEVLKTKIAASLEPVLTPLIQKFIDWTKNNKEVDATLAKVAKTTEQVGKWITSIDVEKLKAQFGTAIKVTEALIATFVALKAISLVTWVAQVGTDLAKLVTSFEGVSAAAGAARIATGAVVAGGALAGAAAVAGYTGYNAYKEIKYNASDEGRIQRRHEIYNRHDKYYSANRYGILDQGKMSREMMDYLMKEKGYSIDQAAAEVGVGLKEGGLNTKALGDGGDAVGVFQWHWPRQKAIEEHFNKRIEDMSLKEQFDAHDWEMKNGTEKKSGRELANSKNLYQANKSLLDNERPAEYLKNGMNGEEARSRYAIAANVKAAYTGQKVNNKISLDTNATIQVIDGDGRKLNSKIIKHDTKASGPLVKDIKRQSNGGKLNG